MIINSRAQASIANRPHGARPHSMPMALFFFVFLNAAHGIAFLPTTAANKRSFCSDRSRYVTHHLSINAGNPSVFAPIHLKKHKRLYVADQSRKQTGNRREFLYKSTIKKVKNLFVIFSFIYHDIGTKMTVKRLISLPGCGSKIHLNLFAS